MLGRDDGNISKDGIFSIGWNVETWGAVKRCTAKLQEEGILKREGAKKKGKWEIVE